MDKIGAGSFGEIHKVFDNFDKKLRAVKLEKKDKKGVQGMIQKESFILNLMQESLHFPRLID